MNLESIWFEVLFIFVLILINGFFSGSEIAIVASKKSRINQMAKEGKSGASIVAGWLKEPEVFLATVQIVVTLVGAMASALGGVAAIQYLVPKLKNFGALSRWAEPISIGVVVITITYFSLLFGELVPKSLAMIYREKMAAPVAVPIHWLSKMARPLVFLLTFSTKIVLKFLGKKSMPKEMFASEEEIRFLIKEGGSQGIFDQTEQQMIPKVFDFSELKIKDTMIPREQITALDISTPRDLLMTKVSEEGFTRLPVYQNNIDKITGILHMKDLIHMITLGKIIILHDLTRPAVFVHESTLAKDLLKLFQKQRLHMAIVQNAKNQTVGLVTLEDLIERIVGDIRDEHDIV